MFDPGSRAQVRERLLDLARADVHVTTAALVGSAAAGREDEWSDIDLTLRVADEVDPVAGARRLVGSAPGAVHGRGRPWQALHMINGLRDQVIELACARHGLPVAQGRGVDDLLALVRHNLRQTLTGSLDHDQLHIAFERLADALLIEAGYVDCLGTRRWVVRSASTGCDGVAPWITRMMPLSVRSRERLSVSDLRRDHKGPDTP